MPLPTHLQACRQIEAASTSANSSFTLREALAVNQHHDAVSGTEKQHVAFDYAKRIAGGINECEEMMGKVRGIGRLRGLDSSQNVLVVFRK